MELANERRIQCKQPTSRHVTMAEIQEQEREEEEDGEGTNVTITVYDADLL